MSLDQILSGVPDPGSYSFPDYSIPKGDPVMPVAVTAEELSRLLALYETLAATSERVTEQDDSLKRPETVLE